MTVIEFDHYGSSSSAYYKCKCDCGNTTIVAGHSLRTHTVETCGKCYHALPDSYKPEYYKRCLKLSDIYYGIKTRCTDPFNETFPNYGGRGIEVKVDRWTFISTYYKEDIDGLEIDRINNDGHYELSNIRWVTRSVNGMNRSYNQDYSFDMIAKRLSTLNSVHKINFTKENKQKPNDNEWFIAEFNVVNKDGRNMSLFIHWTLKDKIYHYINRIISFYKKFGRDDVKCINMWKIINNDHNDVKYGSFSNNIDAIDNDITYVLKIDNISSNTVELAKKYRSTAIPEKQ